MTIADRIRLCRESLCITQDELAKRMGYKDRSNISKIEASANDISLKKISKVAKALGTTESYLMGWEPDDINEKIILEAYRNADESTKQMVMKILGI